RGRSGLSPLPRSDETRGLPRGARASEVVAWHRPAPGVGVDPLGTVPGILLGVHVKVSRGGGEHSSGDCAGSPRPSLEACLPHSLATYGREVVGHKTVAFVCAAPH